MGNSAIGAFGRFAGVIALALAVLAIAACGEASEPTAEAPTATGDSADPTAVARPADGEGPSPAARVAPAFKLPNAAGETVSLASYAGEKNVVLVFYRGFW